jgi:hypothetical protein
MSPAGSCHNIQQPAILTHWCTWVAAGVVMAKKDVTWSMVGAHTTEQGDCSKFKENVLHCCKRDPTIIDLLLGTPFNIQITNCCKAGVINKFNQDPTNVAASFQISVGLAGTTNKTIKVMKNFTLQTPGPGYTYGCTIICRPTKFFTEDECRATQGLSKFPIY